jgi:hypothetical protein
VRGERAAASERAALVGAVFSAVHIGMQVLTPAERRDLIAILKRERGAR